MSKESRTLRLSVNASTQFELQTRQIGCAAQLLLIWPSHSALEAGLYAGTRVVTNRLAPVKRSGLHQRLCCLVTYSEHICLAN